MQDHEPPLRTAIFLAMQVQALVTYAAWLTFLRSVTVQPPKPPPVILDPYTPSTCMNNVYSLLKYFVKLSANRFPGQRWATLNDVRKSHWESAELQLISKKNTFKSIPRYSFFNVGVHQYTDSVMFRTELNR